MHAAATCCGMWEAAGSPATGCCGIGPLHFQTETPWLQVCKQYLLWALKYIHMTYFGLFGAPGTNCPKASGSFRGCVKEDPTSQASRILPVPRPQKQNVGSLGSCELPTVIVDPKTCIPYAALRPGLISLLDPGAPSIQRIPGLGHKVYEKDLLRAVCSARDVEPCSPSTNTYVDKIYM